MLKGIVPRDSPPPKFYFVKQILSLGCLGSIFLIFFVVVFPCKSLKTDDCHAVGHLPEDCESFHQFYRYPKHKAPILKGPKKEGAVIIMPLYTVDSLESNNY